jgi:hypothetical protein
MAGPYTIVLGADAERADKVSLESEILLKNLTQGATYRVQYRALNSIGTGLWSEPALLLVAQAPNQPEKPLLVSVDNTQITVTILESRDNNGSPITAYRLLVNEGEDGTPYHQAYEGLDSQFTLHALDVIGTHTVTTGGIYRFKTTAVNIEAESINSEELIVALARLPSQPQAPTFNADLSTRF